MEVHFVYYDSKEKIMSDLIALNCPSCGGQLHIQNNLQKCFCAHCGVELLLNHNDQGMLIPVQARDLQASAKLKEMQFSLAAMDLLKAEIAELEAKFTAIRNNFLTNIIAIRGAKCFKEYEKENQIIPGINRFCTLNWDHWFDPQWNIPGYTSVDDFLALYRFLQQPKYQREKYLLPFLISFEPLPGLAEELKAKKMQLTTIRDQAINNQ